MTKELKYNNDGLIPAIAFDSKTKKILMLAYMNEESLNLTFERKEAVYWSRSRKCIWHKGKTSGNVQKVKKVLIDCDLDTVILIVDQIGKGACHTGEETCFYRELIKTKDKLEVKTS